MNEERLIINRNEFERLAYEEVQKMRHILFDICCEDYILVPKTEPVKQAGGNCIRMAKEDWERYQDEVSLAIGDLMTARDLINAMKPVFDEYHEEYEKAHNLTFDDYIRMCQVSYDADEFERVRERFENEFFQDISDTDDAR